MIVVDEVKRLKNEIKALRKSHSKPDVAKEELLTFEMLDRYRYIVQQQAQLWRWENVDTLYTFTDRISAWVVDDSVMAIWASGRQGLPNSFANWDSPEKEAGMALMLSRGPSCLGEVTDLEGENVYSAVVVFVHPRQELLSIKEGAGCLVALVEQAKQSDSSSESEVTILCELPKHRYGRFYPSAVNDAYLVLPYTAMKGKPKKLRLDYSMCYNRHLVVHRLHRWQGKLGDLALLPPVFSLDPTLPILLPVGYIGELWLNEVFTTPVAAGGSRLGKRCPPISRLTCCCQEVIAGKTLADWTDQDRVVYPIPLAPKDDAANEPDEPNDAVDDDQCEHGGEPDENATSKKEEDESEDDSDDESKAPKDQTAVSRDSGLGASYSGHGVDASAEAGNSGADLNMGPPLPGLPMPTWFPSMDVLEQLGDDLYAYSGELFRGLEETSLAMLDRILSGFKRLGGRTREYIYETAAIALNFFSRAGDMEVELESSEALKFREAVNGMKESIRDLIRQTASAEESYENAAANFDNILASVSDEVKEFVDSHSEEQRQAYISRSMECIRGVHGSLDGTQFIPLVVSNATIHHALAMSHRVNQSQVPLQIMMLPMRTQAGTMGAGLKFIEYLSRRVLALDVKLGPMTTVSLESGGEGPGVQSSTGMGGRATPKVALTPASSGGPGSSKTSLSAPMPPTATQIHSASRAKTPDTPSKPKAMFSPKASAALAKFKGMSDDDGSSRKRRGKSSSQEVVSKKTKVDDSKKTKVDDLKKTKVDDFKKTIVDNSKKAIADYSKKAIADDDSDSYSSLTPHKSEPPKREVKKKKTKKKAIVDDDSDSYLSPTPHKSEPPKKEVKKKKTKKKALSSDESSSSSDDERPAPKKSKIDRAEAVTWTNLDGANKWKRDLEHVNRYRQRKGLYAKDLAGGPNNTRHVDLLTQLLGAGQLGLNITHIDTRLDELAGESSSSKSAHRLLKALKEVHAEMMGRSGVYPEYVVKAFLVPQSQCVIQKGDSNHWDTLAMIGLYNLHKYEAVGKGNKKVDSKMVTKGYCSFCEYNAGNNGSINNHICLVLECGFANCNVVMYDAERMVAHGKDKHKLETDA